MSMIKFWKKTLKQNALNKKIYSLFPKLPEMTNILEDFQP